jgi:AraC family transcriptional regulator, regulatory protein of adaptative response / methylated-DNA-[protein]-cysteine methyltransferase
MKDFQRIERAIAYLESRFRDQPSVAEVAAHTGLSESHFHRLFQRWAGITPKRFLEYVTAAHARHLLERSEPVMATAFACGLSGGSRLHDLFVGLEGVTPGQIRHHGQGLTLFYGFHDTPFGTCLLARTERGISALEFVDQPSPEAARARLGRQWPKASLVEDRAQTAPAMAQIIDGLKSGARTKLRLDVQGTNFQIRVWEALLKIPPGHLVHYQQLAEAIGEPAAVRACGTAVGANPVPLLIPCHRVIRKTGAFGHYSGGRERKRAILAWESAAA